MTTRSLGVAVCLGLTLVGASSCAGAPGKDVALSSAKDVRQAFTAEGLPLRSSGHVAGGLLLVGVSPGVRQFSVLVLRKEVPPGGVNLTVAAAMRVVPLRNVIVSFDPSGSDASRVKAAIRRLR